MRAGSIILFWMLISPVFWAQTAVPDSLQANPQDAPGEVVDYDAKDIYFAVDSGLGYLTGEAKVVSGTMTLTAHRIVLDLDAGVVCAYGKRDSTGAWVGRPQFQDGAQSFSQDQLCYNFETGKGLSRHAVTTEQDIVFHADRAKRQPDETVHVRDGKFTTCDADNYVIFYKDRGYIIREDDSAYLEFDRVGNIDAIDVWVRIGSSADKATSGVARQAVAP